jgi:DNA-binding transcriptional LysR family regulator
MDARQLEYFLAIVEHGGFRAATSHLHIAQSSLSQAIAGLERELGVALFHRMGRKVVLSDAGHELVGPARQVARAGSPLRRPIPVGHDYGHSRRGGIVAGPSFSPDVVVTSVSRHNTKHERLSTERDK